MSKLIKTVLSILVEILIVVIIVLLFLSTYVLSFKFIPDCNGLENKNEICLS